MHPTAMTYAMGYDATCVGGHQHRPDLLQPIRVIRNRRQGRQGDPVLLRVTPG
jgi:hypothetical protein